MTRRRSKPLTRNTRARRTERSRILIVTEGQITERQYLEALAQHLRATGATITSIDTRPLGKDPSQVVNRAINEQDKTDDTYDEVWAVVDVDQHAKLGHAIQSAKAAGVPVVISNPCFEIWLLWHYEDCRASQNAKGLRDKLTKHGHTDKTIPTQFPYFAWKDASARAAVDRLEHTVHGPNPSSSMPTLIEAMTRAS